VALLSRVHVDVLDVEDGGRDEQRALDRLADVVLVNPARAAGVWQILVERMLSIAAGQRGIVRTRLQALLIAEGVELAVVRSLRRDVETLRSHTATTARRLDRHRALRLGTELVELRRDVQAPLRAAAMAGSMLLVGPPGNGKSGLLAEFIYELLDDGVDLVALRAEDLAARTADELRRELGLEHPLSEVLAGWPGGPGVLIIDGLDAARGADASHTPGPDGGYWQACAASTCVTTRGCALSCLLAAPPGPPIRSSPTSTTWLSPRSRTASLPASRQQHHSYMHLSSGPARSCARSCATRTTCRCSPS
jgi:hypothetical protein